MLLLIYIGLIFVALAKVEFQTPVVGTYFPNWAQYRTSPYTFTPTQLSGAVQYVNMIWYGFAYFCPDPSWPQAYWVTQLGICQGDTPMELAQPEPKDTQYYQQIIAMKSQNPNLKVLLSIGGWNFPSQYFSGMVANSNYRQTFIQSTIQTMSTYGFDGIDLDWEFPCSPARTDPVKISCTDFDYTYDGGGGSCSDDKANLLSLVQEMRAAYGDTYMITVAGQADMTIATNGFDLVGMSKYIDLWNLMSYDYTVSDIDNSNLTAPNQPLYPPSNNANIMQDSTQTTLDGYINAGVDPGMINIGIAYYGHTWYVPGLTGTSWQSFGLNAKVQGECCGPFVSTYGAKYGQYSQLCGSYMYSEIMAAGFDTYYDNLTSSNIGYAVNPTDGWTSEGVWIAYQDKDSITDIINYGKSKGAAGVFAFDISMDTVSGNSFSFELTQLLYNQENA